MSSVSRQHIRDHAAVERLREVVELLGAAGAPRQTDLGGHGLGRGEGVAGHHDHADAEVSKVGNEGRRVGPRWISQPDQAHHTDLVRPTGRHGEHPQALPGKRPDVLGE